MVSTICAALSIFRKYRQSFHARTMPDFETVGILKLVKFQVRSCDSAKSQLKNFGFSQTATPFWINVRFFNDFIRFHL